MSTGTLSLSTPAPAGGTYVQLASQNVAATLPASVKIGAGATSASFTIKTAIVQVETSAVILATQGQNTSSATLTISPIGIQSISLNPSSCTGGGTSAGTITLNGPAPQDGTTVTLSSSSLAAAVPTSVLITKGATSGSFSIDTSPVSSATTVLITGTVGPTAATATLTVNPASLLSISVTPATVSGGISASGSINLTAPAPSSGLTIALTSSNSAASIPASLKIASGKSTASFSVKTIPVTTPTQATITATLGTAVQTASLSIEPPALSGISISASTVHGGTSVTGTVTLTGPAHAGGIVIQLASGQSAATVPSAVTLSQNSSRATFEIKTIAVQTDTLVVITATLNGVSKASNLKVEAPALHTFTLAPASIIGGAAVTGTITLTSPAPEGGITIELVSRSKDASVPVTATIPSGATSTTFQITTEGVTTQQLADITAKFGALTKSVALTIKASTITSFTLNPAGVPGGTATTGTIILNGPAPTNGALIHLSTNNKAGDPPATLLIPSGQSSATFTITTTAVKTQTTVHITASLDGASKTASLTITK